ncbi:hypothetical protein M433DRAFT_141895 [Acidomyces richmondensis BFW]|nr:MAG: hypothetical protein FE78DRAFT_68206 [Acidomyces sp. 'richmondensis']KYG47570.1 hypothetical protein M433DRAFT_141895 [Acidomyces richmondensis BFW]
MSFRDRADSWAMNEVSRGAFFRMFGGWGNVAGPGYFMARVMLQGTITSAVMGLTGAAFGAVIWGTAALPFLIFACGGFMYGSIGFYKDSIRQAGVMLDRFPKLLQLHLDVNFPASGFLDWRREQLRAAVFSRSWVLQSMLICSWLTALPAIDQIMEQRERELIEEARLKMAASPRNIVANADA